MRVLSRGGGSNNELETILDEQYDYYCIQKIIGLAEDGKGNFPYSDLNVEEFIEYTNDDLAIFKSIALTIANFIIEDVNPLLYDNTIIAGWFEVYTNEIFVNKIPEVNKSFTMLYIRCRKVNKYCTGISIPDEIMDIIPEYVSVVDLMAHLEEGGKEVPLIKITAEDYYKGQYFINKSKTINQY